MVTTIIICITIIISLLLICITFNRYTLINSKSINSIIIDKIKEIIVLEKEYEKAKKEDPDNYWKVSVSDTLYKDVVKCLINLFKIK